MKIIKNLTLIGLFTLTVAGLGMAQNYPKATPRPKSTPAVKTPAASTPTPADTPTPSTASTPSGPLKMITTDGKNKNSPIKVLENQYYDSGYGKYNSEVRISARIQNAGKDELKKVTLLYQIVNGDKTVVKEFKQPIGNMKPNAIYNWPSQVWYNSLGVVLHSQVLVQHEEVPKDKDKK